MRERALNNRPLWSLYEHVAMFVGLGSLALACLLWLPFAMLIYPLLPRHTGQAVGICACWGLCAPVDSTSPNWTRCATPAR